MAELKPGLSATIELQVREEHSARAIGVPVFSTPSMISLMEQASYKAVQPHLPGGETTVGTRVDISHLAAAPLGAKVEGRAVLEKVEGRKLTFAVSAWWNERKLGEGKHERFVINQKSFVEKLPKPII